VLFADLEELVDSSKASARSDGSLNVLALLQADWILVNQDQERSLQGLHLLCPLGLSLPPVHGVRLYPKELAENLNGPAALVSQVLDIHDDVSIDLVAVFIYCAFLASSPRLCLIPFLEPVLMLFADLEELVESRQTAVDADDRIDVFTLLQGDGVLVDEDQDGPLQGLDLFCLLRLSLPAVYGGWCHPDDLSESIDAPSAFFS
jgi:hypothetical protein